MLLTYLLRCSDVANVSAWMLHTQHSAAMLSVRATMQVHPLYSGDFLSLLTLLLLWLMGHSCYCG